VTRAARSRNPHPVAEGATRVGHPLTFQSATCRVQGHALEVVRISAADAGTPELVLLHEGLGSVSHWKDFPARVAAATGCAVTVYSRYGSGESDVLGEPRTVRYMHDEALLVLPELLSQLQIENPILVGPSKQK
jgi:pimeloyl-ACP methyl ester carboxylesterase